MKPGCHLIGALLLTLANTGHAQQERLHSRDRADLQRRFQERYAQIVRERVGLDNDQMSKLSELNGRYEGRRRDLFLRERDVRIGLRQELSGSTPPDEDRIKKLLDDQMRLQHERAQLFEEEQGELAKFMSPSQRARYFGLQDQMRRRVEELRGPPDDSVTFAPRDRRRSRRSPPDTTVR